MASLVWNIPLKAFTTISNVKALLTDLNDKMIEAGIIADPANNDNIANILDTSVGPNLARLMCILDYETQVGNSGIIFEDVENKQYKKIKKESYSSLKVYFRFEFMHKNAYYTGANRSFADSYAFAYVNLYVSLDKRFDSTNFIGSFGINNLGSLSSTPTQRSLVDTISKISYSGNIFILHWAKEYFNINDQYNRYRHKIFMVMTIDDINKRVCVITPGNIDSPSLSSTNSYHHVQQHIITHTSVTSSKNDFDYAWPFPDVIKGGQTNGRSILLPTIIYDQNGYYKINEGLWITGLTGTDEAFTESQYVINYKGQDCLVNMVDLKNEMTAFKPYRGGSLSEMSTRSYTLFFPDHECTTEYL